MNGYRLITTHGAELAFIPADALDAYLDYTRAAGWTQVGRCYVARDGDHLCSVMTWVACTWKTTRTPNGSHEPAHSADTTTHNVETSVQPSHLDGVYLENNPYAECEPTNGED